MLLFCCCTLLEVVDSLVFDHKPSQPIFTLARDVDERERTSALLSLEQNFVMLAFTIHVKLQISVNDIFPSFQFESMISYPSNSLKVNGRE